MDLLTQLISFPASILQKLITENDEKLVLFRCSDTTARSMVEQEMRERKRIFFFIYLFLSKLLSCLID